MTRSFLLMTVISVTATAYTLTKETGWGDTWWVLDRNEGLMDGNREGKIIYTHAISPGINKVPNYPSLYRYTSAGETGKLRAKETDGWKWQTEGGKGEVKAGLCASFFFFSVTRATCGRTRDWRVKERWFEEARCQGRGRISGLDMRELRKKDEKEENKE